ncbi:hypothetical protein [Streptomyces sp. ISL-11]|uniref:hypothetical protein n=1 Tax=Streptomyces sp. ISL-11 TaxID=2819174 RepID=UPI001BE77668|nr:hypothetical protein [Streptomyces sp. ISL-11]MBT2383505.1 hypothetical protein [Streptomyces sp. ISL-11]
MNPDEYPEIKSWIDGFEGGSRLGFADFLSEHCTVGIWLAFSHLMNPEFIEVQGCIIRRSSYDLKNFEEWHQNLGGDVHRIESVLNRFVVGYAIDCGNTPEEEAALEDIAQALAYSWEAALARTFPGKRFEVRVADTDDGPTVIFQQMRPSE